MRKKVNTSVLSTSISFKEFNNILDCCISPHDETHQAEQNDTQVFNYPKNLFHGY